MKLSSLLKDITNTKFTDCELNDITLDSREAKKGFLFCAVNGHKIDARKFIPQTIENKVAAIIADSNEADYSEIKDNTTIVYIKDLSHKLSKIADAFYQAPSKKTKIIGITGTNGKTTIAQITAQWATLLDEKSATMGTIGNGFYGDLLEAENTTGSPIEIQKNIAKFVEGNANLVSMEVSSHGLTQGRVDAIDFDIVAFTNLTQDHLDYHNTMEEYFQAKSILFSRFNAKHKVINVDDEYGMRLANSIEDKDSVIAVSSNYTDLENNFTNYVYLTDVEFINGGAEISFRSNFIDATIKSNLIGAFNVSNVLVSLGIMFASDFDVEKVVSVANKLQPVIGRMEVFTKENTPSIIIDYAHTPDALEKALQACRIHTKGELWSIFGCGGDRDVTKRPIMAKIAEDNADRVIVAHDNPRTEDPEIILKDVFEGFENRDSVKTILERAEAIKFAFENASHDDVILVTGKGHEDYQIFGTEKVHYSDRETAVKVLQAN
ncbi:MAG: UDP-N-acetylmuramoyl-L-alanyl-D-glutamate--2,6-diaminopimelate ligase [Proteobacteria bacterium]|nr:UDP-N-acetylmuramoyl-L-alanyl-D-glutamate--2,6-diaminopimelate ligase [Pseudomonadota bacterium]